MPIKVTSSESDEVRTLNIRREGDTVFSFIAYTVEGTQNSGIVYCKLVRDTNTEKFDTVSIYLKLNKPDKKNRREIPLKIPENKKSTNLEEKKEEKS